MITLKNIIIWVLIMAALVLVVLFMPVLSPELEVAKVQYSWDKFYYDPASYFHASNDVHGSTAAFHGLTMLLKDLKSPKSKTVLITQPSINTNEWEGISKRLLREDYHLDPIRREIIEDFINRNKGRTK